MKAGSLEESGGSIAMGVGLPVWKRNAGKLDNHNPMKEVGLAKAARAKGTQIAVPDSERKKIRGLTFLEQKSLRRSLPRYAEL